MPRGRRKQVVEEVVTTTDGAVTAVAEAITNAAPAVEPVVVAKPVASKPLTDAEKMAEAIKNKIAESRKMLDVPLTPSQEFFESPEGYIVIGEKGRGRVWCREANNFQGMWINPRR